VSDDTPGGARGGLSGALAQFGASLVGLVHTRVELAALELGEARERTVEAFVLVHVAVLFLAFSVLAASAVVVVLFWDTYRIAALCGVTLVYLLIGLLALWRLTLRRRSDTPLFAGTLAELERDRAWLADRLGADK
jgi:uncharacterized membrane protein YqjE